MSLFFGNSIITFRFSFTWFLILFVATLAFLVFFDWFLNLNKKFCSLSSNFGCLCVRLWNYFRQLVFRLPFYIRHVFRSLFDQFFGPVWLVSPPASYTPALFFVCYFPQTCFNVKRTLHKAKEPPKPCRLAPRQTSFACAIERDFCEINFLASG